MKLIIDNQTSLGHSVALSMVNDVMNMGRISTTHKGKQYCFVTQFEKYGKKVLVIADKNDKSDKFIIRDDYENKT